MSGPTDQDLEDLAFKIVREGSAKWRGVLPDEFIQVIESRALADLLGTPEGRLRLRRCLADPVVDESGRRATDADGAVEAVEKKGGAGG